MQRANWPRRLFHSLVIALVAVLMVGGLCFVMAETLPGDAAYRIAASRYGYDHVNAAAAQSVRTELGLDLPAWQRLLDWWAALLQGQLGVSLVSGDSVVEELRHQLGATLQLAAMAWGLALVLALALGLCHGWAPQRPWARALDALCTAMRASPAFLTATGLMLLLGVHLQWVPVAGHGEPVHTVLPTLALTTCILPGMVQVISTRFQRLLQTESVTFARTKHMPLHAVLGRHVLPSLLASSLGYLCMQAVVLMEGMVAVESLLAWPGIGHALVHAVFARDVPMLQGAAVVLVLLFVLLHQAADALSRWLDPTLQRHPSH